MNKLTLAITAVLFAAFGFYFFGKNTATQVKAPPADIQHYVELTTEETEKAEFSSSSEESKAPEIEKSSEPEETEDAEIEETEVALNRQVADEQMLVESQVYTQDQIHALWTEVHILSETDPDQALKKLTTFHNDIMMGPYADLWTPHQAQFLSTVDWLEDQIQPVTTELTVKEFDYSLGMIWE